jgi:hypothetical protein
VYPDFLQKHDHFFDRNYTTAFSAGSFSVTDESVLLCSMTRKINHKIWQFFESNFYKATVLKLLKRKAAWRKNKSTRSGLKKYKTIVLSHNIYFTTRRNIVYYTISDESA